MQDIHAIRPPVQVGLDPQIISLAVWALIGLLLIFLAWYIFRIWKKNRAHSKDALTAIEKISAYKAARQSLEALSHSEIKDPRLFYFDLTHVLKKYIGESFDMHAAEMTTQEFTRAVPALDIDREIRQEMIRFSNTCDPIKYAGINPERDRVAEDITLVGKMIDRIEAGINEKEKEDA